MRMLPPPLRDVSTALECLLCRSTYVGAVTFCGHLKCELHQHQLAC